MPIFVSTAAAAPLSPQLSHPSLSLQHQGRGLRSGAALEGWFTDPVSSVPPSLLQEARQQLSSDHRGKMETLDIDRGCLSLNLKSPNISLKINPTRVPSG